jgi:hypothetical protein
MPLRLPQQMRGALGLCWFVSFCHEVLMQTINEREAHLRVLADQLFFVVEKTGQRFTLKRTTDVSKPVCEEGLTLTEAEQLLQRWKLRGFHGG